MLSMKLNCFLLLIIVPSGFARIHTFETTNDTRLYIPLSTFGFCEGGILEVRLDNFTVSRENEFDLFGFSIVKTFNSGIKPYSDTHTHLCLLQGAVRAEYLFTMDLNNLLLRATCGREWKQPEHVHENIRQIMNANEKIFGENWGMKNVVYMEDVCVKLRIPITKEIRNGVTYYNTRFAISILTESEEGVYNLYFHSCPDNNGMQNYGFAISVSEKNVGGYLSAEEMPLPAFYCTMAVLFLSSGCFWVFLLHQSQHPISKMHYLMAALVFLKSLSLVLHGADYYFIKTLGTHLPTSAVLFYIADSSQGALLFITLVLLGTGWTFIKHALTREDKCLLMIIIPLQVLANVAQIILNESDNNMWRKVFILADFLCCGFTLFPAVRTITHLRKASRNDIKAAAIINLRKLKLFRHFFLMIVCYLYLTRIIGYLLKLTLPFYYGWLDVMLREMVTCIFFILTGYEFRPEEDLVISVNVGWKPAQKTLTKATEEESDTLLSKL